MILKLSLFLFCNILVFCSLPISAHDSESDNKINLCNESGDVIVASDCSSIQNQNAARTIIVRTLKKPFAGLKPTTQSVSVIETSSLAKIPTTMTELVEGLPGVAENGQPGHFQVISIRGVSRQRVLTQLEGIRLTSERGAGVAASFVDPLLLQNVQITRGPISTYYGSGAIGGISQLNLQQHDGAGINFGYKGNGNEQFQNVFWGDSKTSGALVKRQANNSQDIEGDPLNTHFEQVGGYVSHRWELNENQFDALLFTSDGNDLGRSNSRFPERVVNVEEENHSILKFALTNVNQWSLDFFAHDQAIISETLRPLNSISNVGVDSVDFGANWQLAWDNPDQSILLGIDYFARRSVDAREQVTPLLVNDEITSPGLPVAHHTLQNGQLDELAVFYTFHQELSAYRFQLGGRFTFEQSRTALSSRQSENAITGFIGVAKPLNKQFEINVNIGSAFRFASLTEKFFSGATARGFVNGNPALQAEKAFTFDFGLQWHSLNHQIKMTLFENDFRNYIDRIQLDEDMLTFENRDKGKIKGIEAEYSWLISPELDLAFNATVISGNNEQNDPLSDIPAARYNLLVSYHREQWSSRIRLQHRASKHDPGAGELMTSAANILSASFSYQFDQAWQLTIFADNLFDDIYLSSADDLATLMPGRGFGISISWRD